ncbi:MAG: DNA polymerase/3'-5' exonuclease PolX [SAR202 cluster bacterium]|jgi:DNA polymerase (family 10)|nr:DNA polymerase/3'-5' exonuclease PolX [SAR202 cluster bacterium]MDP6514712.1 DNA polymerase/3'-5' exonuclease PolX [SAR202 cluster bacterium]MDP6714281.1 DNA polymerase/3'-5' exonuclease PolX [SAR202 cluster bacterium]
MTNGEIAEVFERISGLLEMKGEKSFTIRAYQRASRTIERLPTEVDAMVRNGEDLTEIPGIGKAISEKISELVNTGDLQYLTRLKDEFPPGILELMQIPGLGPKTTVRVWKELGVTTVDQLEAVVEDGSLAALPRLGKKSAENIGKSIQFARSKGDRVPIARAMSVTRQLTNMLRERCPSISQLIVCGSLRRFEETIGDVDLICVTDDGDEALKTLAELPNVADVLGHGGAKTSVVLDSGIQIDMRVAQADHLGAMLQYFTGSLQHNVMLRDRANGLGLSLNEYGLKDVETGVLETFVDEESLYARLGLQYVPPEIRTGESEVKAAIGGSIPRLVDVSDIKGDLHAHTDWSDGRDPMETMVEAAKARGLEYIAMTDHSVGRGIANGLSIERLNDHMALVREVEAEVGGIRVFCGTELDIRADGSLDYADEVLKELDWVVASVHSAMGQDSTVMTERIIAAMKNPYVSAIGHLSTRLIGERKPVDADYESIFRAAADTGTVLEINGSLERLDLKDIHISRARELGAMLVISTDAHMTESLRNLEYGASQARRGWCEAKHIVNTMNAEQFAAWLALDKSERSIESVAYA